MANPVARIDLDALVHNYQRASEACSCPLFAVVKANAYGHGLLHVVDALRQQADGFAVSRVEEALELRSHGVEQRLLVLGGIMQAPEIKFASDNSIEVVIHDDKQLAMLESWQGSDKGTLRVWVKIDTGMHRLGFAPSHAKSVLERIGSIKHVELVGVLTHFANADDLARETTSQQLAEIAPFEASADNISLANSAAILGWPDAHKGWGRPGIMLYGASPFLNRTAKDDGIKPVMTLRTKLISVHELKQGDAIGYGSTWSCPQDMRVGVAAIGYGDGYPRHAPSGTPVLINGKRAPLVGRVSMDLITIDLREHPNAAVGDSVVLWGEGLPVEEIAQYADTISYELFCRLTGRIKFRYEQAP
ncbi:alanine racemase [Solemya velum gill symbiont]|uniref:Alanine racemase n=2 Tax=Solemya velum gill symbiont TaxID=2340 RepID=A0A0B0H3W0_SOVGS|nr:alanine racemase [Solemya velum gill symbiont]KHF24853.1 alanine racemase [Solemya velum gill symbiont]OOY35047.1 alanine racemase [Solemya velum gill symbiont]OOY37749.1 alanine racemase [Solemya velum gill symbiont]OOY40589.1 alanine racemase [Solemya velum gill symbiont]OOY45308.1 alanine racemase [Solemya velum gill symbiont]